MWIVTILLVALGFVTGVAVGFVIGEEEHATGREPKK